MTFLGMQGCLWVLRAALGFLGHTGGVNELTSIWYQLLLMQPQHICANIVHEVLRTEQTRPQQPAKTGWILSLCKRRKQDMHKERRSDNHLGVADEEKDALKLLECLLQPHACFQV